MTFYGPDGEAPAPLDGFGGLFNFTYADSKTAFCDQSDVQSSTLPGLSEESWNAILYYQKGEMDVRIACNLRLRPRAAELLSDPPGLER